MQVGHHVQVADPAQRMQRPLGDVEQPDGARSLFSADGRGPARWGSDSVGYFVGAAFFVRPLGPGRMRELRLTPPRLDPREMTFFPGPAGQGPQ